MIKTPAPKNSNYKMLADRRKATPGPKPQKRANTFSKSRDLREDRGSRQMKTARNTQTFHGGC